ncbi:putative DNA-binding transcriptional regulator YafY, contains an HTH and WYL domains [Fodinibius salinus]|uniref:Putative DNA-binding transcriptional regulator YafY, contains an HTH and WYL domains n=1 Tax=Fodinibius salinus TaxID=860790 RepID=A0A5D3YM03_9BACT|nr:YafY family protein [Fodinibius salinus]TYP93727.1 putative DNA-binding transcriptional regulator YafY, contains an HTH and WYL domains [Fodinibius salinus]
MNSSERRMKLILMLQQSNSRIMVDDIAEKFDVSRRTVFRDFNSLSEMNVPVTYDKYNGYGIMRSYKIPPLMFTSKELATIMVGLNFVKSQIDKKLIEDAKGVELKIKEVVPDDLLEFMESLEERTVVDPYLNFGGQKMEGGDWYIISNAISENQSIKCEYRAKSNEEVTNRKIDPYLIVFFRDHWNVIGHSHKRDAVRNFVLDRMSDIQILDENFVPHGKIDVEGLIFRSDESSYKVEVDVQKSALKRFKANLPAKIINKKEIKPNLFRFSFFFDNLRFINEWLLQFPRELKIVGPELLIEKRKKLLKEMMEPTK